MPTLLQSNRPPGVSLTTGVVRAYRVVRKGSRQDLLPRVWGGEICCTMPGKIVKPCALDFDADLTVCIGLSFERKLILILCAAEHRWKSVHGTLLSRPVSDCLSTPMSSSMRRSLGGIVDQAFDGIDVSRIESPDRIMFYDRDPFTSRPIGSDK
jgi:hypothetical protein